MASAMGAVAGGEGDVKSTTLVKRPPDNRASSTILKFMLDQLAVDNNFRALAEPTRRAIVERLSRGPASVSDLARPFDMSLAAIVQHLKVLEECGLIRSQKVRRVRTCRIDTGGLNTLADWVAERRSLIERRLDQLREILAETDQSIETTLDESKETK
jgi:DNA-binding transcriptional ArsR family regulator